ncbi:MAG TPA: HAD-IA family hydrolase [Casimicrobiaceae bacterium]|nr:HAD-IA family hydrolase [Casimicrobiaceae bacterium]
MSVRLLVFDWDGTLADSTDIIAGVLQSACRDLGCPVPDDEAARHVIGLGLADALRHAAPTLQQDEIPRLSALYRHHYLAREPEIELFEGAHDLLARLARRGHLLGIATGKTRAGLDRALARHELAALFHATRCADESPPKPDPAMLVHVMSALDVLAAETIMIGDTTHDLEMARRAGVRSIAMAHGAHAAEKLRALQPVGLVQSLRELDELLVRLS